MSFLKKHYPALTIWAVSLILFITNYVPGTYLAGWDSLQTELNPGLGLKRNFFSTWQEYQSFGLAAGMGHAADLLRTVILWFVSFVLPQSLIRYSFQMSMIPLGAFGMYQLLRLSGFSEKKRVFALLGSLFYILNFAVIQMMFLPFEAFSVFFGLLPWLLWAFLRLFSPLMLVHVSPRHSRENGNQESLDSGSEAGMTKKEVPPTNRNHIFNSKLPWLLFILINIAGTPAFIAQQLFVVYVLLLGLLGLGILIRNFSVPLLKRGIIAGVIILLLNSFWLLPQVYFLASGGVAINTDAKINQIATEDVFFVNKDKGNLKDFLSFTGFFYDSTDSNQQPLFAAWHQHREALPIMLTIYALSAVVILGLLLPSVFRLPFTLGFFLIALGLLTNTPPFAQINDLLRQNSLINQIFRSPFTKFSIPYALIASYFFTTGAEAIYRFLSRFRPSHLPFVLRSQLLASCSLLLLFFLIVLTAFPAFRGYYISPTMKVTIPNAYFQAIDYFKSVDKNQRIALLPDYTYWGWFHNRWGYDGSGFLWYGIEQPIVSRTFDVWDTKSESYFWEVKRAIESENVKALEQVVEKYNISYLLLDKTLLPIVSNNKGLQYDSLNQMLRSSKKIHPVKDFGEVQIYAVSQNKPIQNFIWGAKTLPNIGPAIQITNEDTAYNLYGDYLTNPSSSYDAYFPFLDLTTQTHLAQPNWSLSFEQNLWQLSGKIPESVNSYHLTSQNSEPINLYRPGGAVSFVLPLTSQVIGDQLLLQFPPVTADSFAVQNTSVTPCLGSAPSGTIQQLETGSDLTVSSTQGGIACFTYTDYTLDQRYGYIVTIKDTHQTGRNLFFYALDRTKNQAAIEDSLTNPTQYYILGKKNTQGIGYDFTFQNKSHSTIPTENTLQALTVDLMPYDEVKPTRLLKATQPPKAVYTTVTASKQSYYRYTASVSPQTKVLVLNQAYRPGWHAYQVNSRSFLGKTFPSIFGTEIKTHVPIDNWANGWILPANDPPAGRQGQGPTTNDQIIILYTPQYLEYLGLILVAGIGVYITILFFKKK